MKMFATAIALVIASPALAQSAAPANAHTAHSGHSASSSAQPSSDAHAGHDMGGMMMSAEAMEGHCDKMKAEGKTMEGCDMQAPSKSAADPHAGHNMSPQ